MGKLTGAGDRRTNDHDAYLVGESCCHRATGHLHGDGYDDWSSASDRSRSDQLQRHLWSKLHFEQWGRRGDQVRRRPPQTILVVASYLGDANTAPSSSATLNEVVTTGVGSTQRIIPTFSSM